MSKHNNLEQVGLQVQVNFIIPSLIISFVERRTPLGTSAQGKVSPHTSGGGA